MSEPFIILTNDDGIESPGLLAAAEALLPLGRLVVIAPSRQQTSMGRSLWQANDAVIHEKTITIAGQQVQSFHCDSAPARCILHALTVFAGPDKPDLLVSGINYGENLGTNISISGTLGAAEQAAAMDIKAMAISVQTPVEYHYRHAELDWSAARYFTSFFAMKMLESELPHDVDFLNINIPETASADTPWKWTHQSRFPYFSSHLPDAAMKTRLDSALCVIDLDSEKIEPSSDIAAIAFDKLISVTPLSLDSTSRIDLNTSNALFS